MYLPIHNCSSLNVSGIKAKREMGEGCGLGGGCAGGRTRIRSVFGRPEMTPRGAIRLLRYVKQLFAV